ncbi:MAG TPA: ATP-binding protein [Longimicrobium sp.]
MNAWPEPREAPDAEPFYPDGFAHLADELDRLNLLLRLRTAAARRRWLGRPESAGSPLCVSDAEVDALLNGGQAAGGEPADEQLLRRALGAWGEEIEARVAGSLRRGIALALPQLARLYGLSAFEVQAVLVCLAPELRRGYDRVYAYLQDDITRRRPSVDLVLELLCETEAERWSARALLAPQSRLLHAGILQAVDDPHSPSASGGLAQLLRLDPRILHYLLGHDATDARLTSLVRLHRAAVPMDALPVDAAARAELGALARAWGADGGPRRCLVVHLHGPRGVGRRELAAAFAAELGAPLLALDAHRLPADPDEADALLRLAMRESLLLQAPLYLAPAEVFVREGDAAAALRAALARSAEWFGWLVFLGGEGAWAHPEAFAGLDFHSVALPLPAEPEREAAWRQALEGALPDGAGGELPARLAERFRLTPGQVREAARAAAHRADVDGAAVDFEALAAACRAQARHNLAGLAARVEPRYGWEDLVLPEDRLAQLREMCEQVRHARQVYERWGFGRKLARGRGLSALFSGPPGTGKTMAAEVLAAELRLDLYKVDLARVVSKYIGETEKNLSRIFAEAEDSNAILFFDEADALFGRRTEVADAHDRYANIETSYLLQRMEEYAGIVVLASNLRENMDDAFLRRIRFLVDFPFPDAPSRRRIWEAHFPPDAPVGGEVDYGLLGERIQVAGGNIKNIALHAAFLAAADGGVIVPAHILRATRREFEKIGKLWDEAALTRGRR